MVQVIIGAQFGDEAKGAVEDRISANCDVSVRPQGGGNTGRSIYIKGEKVVLHHLPSGIKHDHVFCIMGTGMVIHPGTLIRELEELRALGIRISPDRLMISERAQAVLETHMLVDAQNEEDLGGKCIGTTKKGIGPAYEDYYGRRGVPLGLMRDPQAFANATVTLAKRHNRLLTSIQPYDLEKLGMEAKKHAELLGRFVGDDVQYLHEAIQREKNIVVATSQGVGLDCLLGTHPFCTSSLTTAGGALAILGIPPRYGTNVLGVMKPYMTRVGAGVFPTEQNNEFGERLRQKGVEFGSTTGRPRRCGWLDLPLQRYFNWVGGLTALAIPKLDVLSGFESIPICTSYMVNS